MFYIRPLYLCWTTEGDYNTPFGVSEQRHATQPGNEGTQERSCDVPDVVDKKRDRFLVCFVQNI